MKNMQMSFVRCPVCVGSGYQKRTPKICKYCDGKVCIHCQMNGGYEIQNYETCRNCEGKGTVQITQITQITQPANTL